MSFSNTEKFEEKYLSTFDVETILLLMYQCLSQA